MGVLEIGEDNRILEFKEKPDKPESIPGRSGFAWANMGVYVLKLPF
jgi:glucose-1-phosphate adenylyltransferase